LKAINRLVRLVKDVRRSRYFKGPFVTIVYSGVYASYSEATSAIPPHALQGFEHSSAVKHFEGDGEAQFKHHDYPAIFWLAKALKTSDSVFDLGGGWGQTYYAYKNYLEYPGNLCWTVCDVDAFVRRGREVAETRGEKHLKFTVNSVDANAHGILLTGGALQYMEEDLPEILDKLESKPQHVIVNRLPLYDGSDFYTIQRMSYSYGVYKIMNREQFLKRMSERGYELRDSWHLPRSIDIVFHPEHLVTLYSGFYWTRKATE
jgi:putative methyltransferase (TIGR04325 family)